VKRLLGWIAGALGGMAAYRFLRRQQMAEPAPVEPDARADELRAKLAESRETEEPLEQPHPESPEDRRRRVHEEGRATLDDMGAE
jgi:hypothetical protein